MTKLRICLGLIATALLLGALPAHAGTTFRTAKVCAQTQSGIKITGVKLTWTYPGTVGGSGTTDKTGCFTAQYLPVGNVTLENRPFNFKQISTKNQTYTFKVQSISIVVSRAGIVQVNLPDPKVQQVGLRFLDPSDNPVVISSIAVVAVPTEASNCDASDFLWFSPLVMGATYWEKKSANDAFFSSIFGGPTSMAIRQPDDDYRNFKSDRILFSDISSRQVYRTYKPCIRARAKSGSQQIETFSFATLPVTTLTFSGYLPGFQRLPGVLKAKSGKVTLTATLRDNQNQPIWGMPVAVSESKVSNPNIGKKVGSCKPALAAKTNPQGKVTFTLCPTKNTTVTVKVPPLGIVSQSIKVTK